MRKLWTAKEQQDAITLKVSGLSDYDIAEKIGRSSKAVNTFLSRMRLENKLPTTQLSASNMPVWDSPLVSEGDALILSDVEAPFQNSEFINRCIDLAEAWGIKTLHLAGDLLHYDNLSAWGSEWVEEKEDMVDALREVLEEVLKPKQRELLYDRLQARGIAAGDNSGGGLSGELKEARSIFRAFQSFDSICVALGNHDDRYLRALDNALHPRELLHQLDRHNDKRWRIAAYYYTLVETEAGVFRITHPRGSGKSTAIDLAIQFQQHVVMGHSHRWSVNRDPSGKLWAIQTGACVDERRLAYVMQRDAKRDAHIPGATIIRGGFPFVLCPETPWTLLKRM